MRDFVSVLAEVRSGLQLLSGLSVDALPADEVRVVARDLEGLRRMLDGVATSVAGRLVSGCGRDARAVVARSFGVAPVEASRLQRQAQVVDAFPAAAVLLADGLVSPEHVRCLQPLVANAVDHQHVVAKAVGVSVSEFARVVAEALIGDDFGEGLLRKQHEARYLSFGRNPLGMITVNGALPEVFGLTFSGRLKALADRAWRDANPTRPSAFERDAADSYGQRLCDALEQLVTNPHAETNGNGNVNGNVNGKVNGNATGKGKVNDGKGDGNSSSGNSNGSGMGNGRGESWSGSGGNGSGGNGVAVVLTVDVDSGSAAVVGHGPVATSTALSFLGRPDTRLFVAQTRAGGREVVDGRIATVARGSKLFQTVTRDGIATAKQSLRAHLAKTDPSLLDRYRRKREATLAQRLVVVMRDHQCVVPGCELAFDRCEVHHVDEYDNGGPTIIVNLVLLCKAHHHWLHNNKHTLKLTTDGWTVHGQNGRVIARPPPQPTMT